MSNYPSMAVTLLLGSVWACGKGEKKTITISDFRFCEERNEDGLCEENSESFAENIVRVYGQAGFDLHDLSEGRFAVEWARMDEASPHILGTQAITPNQSGRGYVHTDVIEPTGLQAGTYRLRITFTADTGQGEGEGRFLVVNSD